MRIIFDVIRDGLSAINTANRQFSEAQRQMSSGKRVSGAGDDPLAVQQAIGERANIAAIDAYTRTNATASARLSAVDTVLSSIGDKLTAASVAGLSARGTQVDPAVRAAASAQVRSLRDAILSDVNTSFQGSALFAGTAVDQKAYVQSGGSWTYQGNSSTTKVEVERGRSVAVTFDGQSILQGSDATNVLNSLDALATAIDNGDNDAIGAEIEAVERAFSRTQRALGALGADEQGVAEASVRLASLRSAADIRRSTLEDANMAEAVTRVTQAETAYRAALSAVSTAERQSLLDYLR